MRSDILLLRSSRRLLTVLSILVEVRVGAVGAPRPSGPLGLLDPSGSLGLCGAFTRQRKRHFFCAGNFFRKAGGVESKTGLKDPQGVFACWHKRWSPARR